MSDEFTTQLQRVREASGRSLRELERAVHVSNSSLSRYLTGQAVPPWPVVVALCKLAGHDPRPLRPLWEARKRDHRPPAAPAPPVPPPTARNDLPHDVGSFTGRREELAALLAAARTTRIVAIDGMAGVGKTTLAVHAAHRLTEEYPDGQLYLDLHGFTPGRQPVPPAEALRVLLTALGMASARLPESTEERAALWRAELANRRAVVVLDNAADAAQVQPLLPGAGTSLTLVTSRRRMLDLDGAHPLSLEVLPSEDAAALFVAAVGDGRAEDSPMMAEVVRRCGRLPLALRIAGARLRHRPAWTIDTLVARLRDGDLGVGSVFTMSVQQLDPGQRRMFSLLGLVPGSDIDPHAAASLADRSLGDARSLLDDLVDAHLLQEPTPERYRQHDLLRGHALTIAATEEAADVRHAALTRLFDHYLYTASAAVNLRFPEASHLGPDVPEPDTPTVRFDGAAEATAWLDTERANLVAAGTYAADHEWPSYASRLAAILYPYLDTLAHHAEAVALYAKALQAAQRSGDRAGEVRALIDQGIMNLRQGRYERAHEHSKHALDLCREIGDRYNEARALNSLGNVYLRQRDHDQAYEHFRPALDLSRQVGDRLGEAIVLSNLGLVHARLDHPDQAYQHLRRCLDQFRELGSVGGQATALGSLGLVHRQAGRYEEARAHHRQALDLYRRLGYPSGEADALNSLGELSRCLADPARAIEEHGAALAAAQAAGNHHELARAHDGLTRAYLDSGDREPARDHATQALDMYTRLGLPEADEIRDLLAHLSS